MPLTYQDVISLYSVGPYSVPRTRIPGNVTPGPYGFPRTRIPGNVGPLPPLPLPVPAGDVRMVANRSGAYWYSEDAIARAARTSGAVVVAQTGWLPFQAPLVVLQKGGDPLGHNLWLVSFGAQRGWMLPRTPSGATNISGDLR